MANARRQKVQVCAVMEEPSQQHIALAPQKNKHQTCARLTFLFCVGEHVDLERRRASERSRGNDAKRTRVPAHVGVPWGLVGLATGHTDLPTVSRGRGGIVGGE